MSMSDPIADLLTRIRNASSARHAVVEAPSSKLVEALLKVIKQEGYIRDFKTEATEDGHKKVRIELKYVEGQPVFSEIVRISKPGRRVYSACKDLQKVHGGLGIYILSTPKGLLPDYEARQHNVGGEIVCKLF